MEGRGAGGSAVAMFGMLMTVAVIAVIVSQRAQTANILTELGKSTGKVIGAAVSPVTGGGSAQNYGPQSSPN